MAQKQQLDDIKSYYVYGHFYKRWPNIPFYIGKGRENRSHCKHSRNRLWKNIVNKYGKYNIKILYKNLNEYDSFSLEILSIYAYGRRDKGEGPLVNMTDGGDGNSGGIMSDKQKQLLREYALKHKIIPPKTTEDRLKTMRKLVKTPLGKFKSVTDAATAYNLTQSAVSYRCKMKIKGFSYIK